LIDRCGKHFGSILNYLRDGSITLPESRYEIAELLAEAKYYLIQGLFILLTFEFTMFEESGRHKSLDLFLASIINRLKIVFYTNKQFIRLTCSDSSSSTLFEEVIQ